MLKALIQLFSESFLKSKRAWVCNQSYCGSNFVAVPFITGTFASYVAPSDGIFALAGASCTAIDIIVQGSYLRVNMARSEKQILAGYVPLSKGQQVDFVVLGDNLQSNSAKFFPAIGPS